MCPSYIFYFPCSLADICVDLECLLQSHIFQLRAWGAIYLSLPCPVALVSLVANSGYDMY